MITTKEADDLAVTTIKNYIDACNCMTTQDVGNALMKLVSSAGLSMKAGEGQDVAIARLMGTANYVARVEIINKPVKNHVN